MIVRINNNIKLMWTYSIHYFKYNKHRNMPASKRYDSASSSVLLFSALLYTLCYECIRCTLLNNSEQCCLHWYFSLCSAFVESSLERCSNNVSNLRGACVLLNCIALLPPSRPCKLYLHFSCHLLQVSPALSERLRVFEYLREKQRKKKRADTADTPLSIRLAGGRTVKGTAGVTTPLFVAHSVR